MDISTVIIYAFLIIINLVVVSSTLYKRFSLKQKISYKDFLVIF